MTGFEPARGQRVGGLVGWVGRGVAFKWPADAGQPRRRLPDDIHREGATALLLSRSAVAAISARQPRQPRQLAGANGTLITSR